METKELKISVPAGYEIDKENSTFECIKFKKIAKKWKDSNPTIKGWYLGGCCPILYRSCSWEDGNYNVFNTEKQAKSALAMAKISQIMANDDRFGGVVTDEEWNKRTDKYVLYRSTTEITKIRCNYIYQFLAFHTAEQRDLFLRENEDLVRDYLMID